VSVRRSVAVVTLLAPWVLPGFAVAQDVPRAPTFGVEVDIVKVTVTVFDDAGKAVTGLEREDFEVFEDRELQRIDLFAKAYEPGDDETLEVDLGLLLDTSESMLDVLEETQSAAARFLEAIPRARDLLMVFFDHDIRVSRYDSEHQQGLIRRLHDAKGGGQTALYDAITVYLSRVYGVGGRQVMVLFSDGEDSSSSITMGETLELVRSSNVAIYPIAFVSKPGRLHFATRPMAFLRQIASLTGGEMFLPTGTRTLPEIYDEIVAQLESQYVIGFVSSQGRRAKAGYRKLEVKVKKDDLEARHRDGYFATVPPGAEAPDG